MEHSTFIVIFAFFPAENPETQSRKHEIKQHSGFRDHFFIFKPVKKGGFIKGPDELVYNESCLTGMREFYAGLRSGSL
ncbi:MAG: hypothetical protein C4B58_03835 [Deltaproteobacteria bacterium]|nr:MAG: hypothetical protein C4B58_03835 [Deltaproteobacteria bacterium]